MTPSDETTLSVSPQPARQAARPVLVGLFSPDPTVCGHVYPLPSDPVCLGRNPGSAGLAFADRRCSRRHADITWDEQRQAHVVRDRDSHNGTFINGRRVRFDILLTGDRLRLGDTFVRFEVRQKQDEDWWPPPDRLLLGHSAGLRRVLRDIGRAATSDLSVLIIGETGTGKELVAEQLHRDSGRSGPLVALNCAAIPAELMENELFGHRRGAFSGALQDEPGVVGRAEGGTLFFDEVGELAPPLQAKLLRVLESRRVRPLGASQDRSCDVRFVFATNRDLQADVAAKRFRTDLFARLIQWPIHVPPLRERPEDLWPIIEHIVAQHGQGRDYPLSGDAFEALAAHRWPFNVRELIHAIRQAMVRLTVGGPLTRAELPDELQVDPAPETWQSAPAPPSELVPTPRELVGLLRRSAGNIADLARRLGRQREVVYRWLRNYEIDPDHFRE